MFLIGPIAIIFIVSFWDYTEFSLVPDFIFTNYIELFESSVTYSIYLKDSEGNRQTLSDTIAYILEQRDILDHKVMYVAAEMEKQWLEIEKMKMVTGTDKFDT